MGVEQGHVGGRLTPEMRSRKLQALDFIKRYFARWGRSPTLGELAAELSVSGKRAYDLVHSLADERMLEVTAGKTRGIRLIDRSEEMSEADVLLRLSAMGWTIGQGERVILPPENPADAAIGAAIVQGLTEKGLHGLPVLDHDPEPPRPGGERWRDQ
jgi:hypothetical protein